MSQSDSDDPVEKILMGKPEPSLEGVGTMGALAPLEWGVGRKENRKSITVSPTDSNSNECSGKWH